MNALFATIFNICALLFYPIVFILLILLVLFIFKRFRRLIIAALILLVYFFSNGILTKPVSDSLQESFHRVTHKEILENKAMIVLGAGLVKFNDEIYPSALAYSRLNEAARIYYLAKKHDISYTIFVSGGSVLNKLDTSEASVYKNYLVSLGIPVAQIIAESQSNNTYENAKNLSFIIKNYPFKQFLLVTSGAPSS